MSANIIQVQELCKVYRVPIRESGLTAAMRGLVKRQHRDVVAVDDISFSVEEGEIIGFLGPNGAGKTTTLKMLSGLLHPSSGKVQVLNHTPWQREADYLRQITLVMGNRNQLAWDIPCADSFEVNRIIYRLSLRQYRDTLDELVDLLDLEVLLPKPVRNLSLGERMKVEIAGALLHRPQVLFLDEPTIGLDVTMQRRIRTFIRAYNQRHGATVMLTSHYMADVEALCKRVVLIHEGHILFDGALNELVTRFSPHKTISLEMQGQAFNTHDYNLAQYGELVDEADGVIKLRVPKSETASVTGQLLADLPITDLTVEEPPIEAVIEQAFSGEETDAVLP
ncbi:MAG: ATP-binding cassette domain-containing protein [Chloroflexota bacterium]